MSTENLATLSQCGGETTANETNNQVNSTHTESEEVFDVQLPVVGGCRRPYVLGAQIVLGENDVCLCVHVVYIGRFSELLQVRSSV